MDGTVKGIKTTLPAVELSIAGKVCVWEDLGGGKFRSGALTMRVRYVPFRYGVRKVVEIASATPQPTPDYLVIDRRELPDPALKMRGYVATAEQAAVHLSDEEGGGVMPGCGYPLIGKKYFLALEHQCGFNTVLSRTASSAVCELRQHPVWEHGKLATMTAVFCASDDPEAAFRRYVADFQRPGAKRALFSFCSFWSEPFLGNYEYVIGGDNYRSFVDAFAELGLRPEVYTLDAGWQDRNSIFAPKEAAGGEPGLVGLRRHLQKRNSELSLWVSHNGPMGMAPEYLEKLGIATGGGQSSTYRGPKGFGVLMDAKLEQLLTERFCALVTPPVGAVHLKMDWDNDCATAPKFKEKYPTRNHVREASVNVQNRIALAIRRANPSVVIRHGWWPSPWQLKYSDHLFLADSGDCEHCSVPSLDQRDCTLTARDIQYFNVFRRDGSMIPLNAVDHHDFPQAPRNPFAGDDGVWSDTALWTILRGSGYLPWTIQPEALTDSQAKILREAMAFARKYQKILFGGRSVMVGGNPRHGEIYGFRHPLSGGAVFALRNPLPIPQVFADVSELSGGLPLCQLYPDCRRVTGALTFGPHEVKILQSAAKLPAWGETPFRYADGVYHYPASATTPAAVAPRVAEVYRVNGFVILDAADQKLPDGMRYWFKLRAPYRMRNCALYIRLTGAAADDVSVKLFLARDARSTGNCFAVPLTGIVSGNPGRGEYRNPEVPTAWGRFLRAEAPCGGTGCFRLELRGAEVKAEVWAAGFETDARRTLKRGPSFGGLLRVPAHPLGFPVYAKMEVSGHEEPVKD